jgi:hypothetical protein
MSLLGVDIRVGVGEAGGQQTPSCALSRRGVTWGIAGVGATLPHHPFRLASEPIRNEILLKAADFYQLLRILDAVCPQLDERRERAADALRGRGRGSFAEPVTVAAQLREPALGIFPYLVVPIVLFGAVIAIWTSLFGSTSIDENVHWVYLLAAPMFVSAAVGVRKTMMRRPARPTRLVLQHDGVSLMVGDRARRALRLPLRAASPALAFAGGGKHTPMSYTGPVVELRDQRGHGLRVHVEDSRQRWLDADKRRNRYHCTIASDDLPRLIGWLQHAEVLDDRFLLEEDISLDTADILDALADETLEDGSQLFDPQRADAEAKAREARRPEPERVEVVAEKWGPEAGKPVAIVGALLALGCAGTAGWAYFFGEPPGSESGLFEGALWLGLLGVVLLVAGTLHVLGVINLRDWEDST